VGLATPIPRPLLDISLFIFVLKSPDLTEFNANVTVFTHNPFFCFMASLTLQTTPTTGSASGSTFHQICVCLCSVIFTRSPYQVIFLSSLCLPAAFFDRLLWLSSLFDFRPAHATFPNLMVGMKQIPSSVFFEFL
jgi:hypothetical protein